MKDQKVYGRYTTVSLYGSSNCLLTDLKVDKGISLSDDCNSNNITKCEAKLLHIGLLSGGNKNLITKNNIIQQLFVVRSNNSFSRNDFLLTKLSGIGGNNFWDYDSIGNYWGNYSIKYPNASEIGKTGIGETSYIIERERYTTKEYPKAKNIDNYPLMYPWGAPEIALLGMQNTTYIGSCLLNVTVSKSVSWMGYSLDRQENVTITGNVTLGELSSGLHNVTVYAEDMFGNMGTSETISFTVAEPEPKPFPTTLVIASVSTVAVVGLALLVYLKKRKR